MATQLGIAPEARGGAGATGGRPAASQCLPVTATGPRSERGHPLAPHYPATNSEFYFPHSHEIANNIATRSVRLAMYREQKVWRILFFGGCCFAMGLWLFVTNMADRIAETM